MDTRPSSRGATSSTTWKRTGRKQKNSARRTQRADISSALPRRKRTALSAVREQVDQLHSAIIGFFSRAGNVMLRLFDLGLSDTEFWLGLKWCQPLWKSDYGVWSDGTPSSYLSWAKGEPSSGQTCVATNFKGKKGEWDNKYCSFGICYEDLQFVCETNQSYSGTDIKDIK